MQNLYKVNSKYCRTLAVLWIVSSITLFVVPGCVFHRHIGGKLTNTAPAAKPGGKTVNKTDSLSHPAKKTDTLPGNVKRTDTTGVNDTSHHVARGSDTVHVKMSKDSLDAPVTYSAADSMVLDFPAKTITLYNKASVKQKDINLDAYKIILDQDKQVLIATETKDTAGAIIGQPKFVQAENNMTADTIIFSTKTQKGYTRNTYTNEQEMFVNAQIMKKISKNEYYAWKGRITTCDMDPPHFAFVADKMKLVNGKVAITGPVHPEFEGVPIPIYIPFGFFPLSQGRHSGLLPPQFSANQQFGVGLEGLGYYKVLNDNFDVTTRGDIYSYGGYRINITPTYRVRYRYQGSMTLSFQNSRILNDFAKGGDYSSSKTFNISWSHTVDSRARPGQTFSASVNAGSTQFNKYVTTNPQLAYNNQLSSSIAYSKNWSNKYNLTVSANHQQNNLTRLISVNLPNAAFTVNNFYPFQRKAVVGEPKWYEKLGIGLNSSFANQVSFYDSLFSLKRLIDTLQYGAQHSIPISLSLPALGPFQISPGISYRENWYGSKFISKWDNVNRKIDTTTQKGFYRSSDVSFSLGINTALYGMDDHFSKTGTIVAIRHTIRPSLSISYDPGLAKKDYYTFQVDSTGRTAQASYFQNSMFGSLTGQAFGGLSFGIDNNLEMKVRSKKDTANGGIKKIKLLDGFGFNGSYNFMADSFKLSNMSLYLRSTLFDKINITGGANLDPYVYDSMGFRKNIYAWNNGKFSLGKITGGNLAISTSFKSKSKDSKGADSTTAANNASNANGLYQPMTLEEQQAQLQYVRNNPAEYADFNVQWTLNVSYSLSFTRTLKTDYSGYSTIFTSNVNLSGDFNLTPKWKVGMSTYYDFDGSGLQNVTAFVSRDLHCWQMSINVYSGLTKGFNITINPKSGLLRDLKINRSRYFYNNAY